MNSLPEELICKVIEPLAYHPSHGFDSVWHQQLKFRWVSDELRSLSLINQQIRRICLPLLFAYARVSVLKKLEAHDYSSQSPLSLTKHLWLNFKEFEVSDSENFSLLRDALPQLGHLSWVDMTGVQAPSGALLDMIQKYSASTVIVAGIQSLPRNRAFLDLSRITVLDADHPQSHTPRSVPASSSAQTPNVCRLHSSGCDRVHQVYRGLRELHFHLVDVSPMPWFLAFTSNHPLLSTLVFNFFDRNVVGFHHLPFLHSFVENSHQVEPGKFCVVQLILIRTCLTTDSSITRPFQGWHVSEMEITICSSPIEILALISASLPRLNRLSILLRTGHDCEYEFDELINVLGRFRSLQGIDSGGLFSFVRELPSTEQLPDLLRPVDLDTLMAKVQSRVHRFASCIALAVSSLQSFSIMEENFPIHDYTCGLYADLDVRSSDRKVTGQLFRFGTLDREWSLE
ncbi:hypothetical protein D9757_005290 [Collybiopsis confluens]|uniref:Uncharacterized protein n=1 Tax=Collybiopsis confluens TaxID=2823264 RepID=A0A8H5HVZ3_9AGAR|nr:hypothetical protein D9757_005290 [Collybiopsis confluens]